MSAQRTAATLTAGDSVPWRSLEASAFDGFPEVVAQLQHAPDRRRSTRTLISLAPLALLVAVIYALPVWGIVTVVGPWGLSQTDRTAQGDITAGGIIFTVALVSLLAQAGFWLSSGRPARTALTGSSALAAVLGGLSAGVAVMRGTEHDVPAWELWALAMAACAVAGCAVFALVMRARRRPGVVHDHREPDAGHAPGVRELVERVPGDDRESIRRDLHAAIDDLQRRAVITVEVADLARSAELGGLAAKMASSAARGVSHPEHP